MPDERRDLRDLCEAASRENDSEKLIALVSELVEVLDDQGVLPGHPEVKGFSVLALRTDDVT